MPTSYIQYWKIAIRHSRAPTPPHAPPPGPFAGGPAWCRVVVGGIPYGYISILDIRSWMYTHIWKCWKQISASSRPQPEYIGWATTAFLEKWPFCWNEILTLVNIVRIFKIFGPSSFSGPTLFLGSNLILGNNLIPTTGCYRVVHIGCYFCWIY